MDYTYEEAKQKTLEYFNNNEFLTNIFLNKYILFDSKTNTYKESNPNDMFIRVAKELARIEQNYDNPISYDEILNLIKDFKYIIPGGSNLYGIGNDYSYSSLGNCFVIGTENDSYGAIFKNDEELAQLMKRRGGVGHDISYLRPAGAVVSNSAKYSTGAISFMERFSNTTREVAQDGRRGALMLSIDIKHPDAQEFISIKDDLKKVTGANISVKISNDFMNAVLKDEYFYQTFPIEKSIEDITGDNINTIDYNVLYKGIQDGTYYKKIKAKELWDKIIYFAHKNAEPGLLFWDHIINNSPGDVYSNEGFNSLSTNPCAEQALPKYSTCRLMSLNLYSYVENPFTKDAWFNYAKYQEHIIIAQRLMDDIIDLEAEKIDRILSKIDLGVNDDNTTIVENNLWIEVKKKLLLGRRSGLSSIGIADTLAALNIPYASVKGISTAEQIYKELTTFSYMSSIIMAKERGKFEVCDVNKEKDHVFISKILNEFHPVIQNDYIKYGRRNIANTTCPPSGTISNLAQITSGIEPVYQIYYTRRMKVNPNDKNIKVDYIDDIGDHWQEYKVFHPKFITWYNIYTENEGKQLSDLSKDELNEIIEQSSYYKQTSHDINPSTRVEMQSHIQQWIDSAISSTINLSKETTKETISEIYVNAWKNNLKGVTVYRDGSRSGVLITADEIKSIDTFEPKESAKRPKHLPCNIHRLTALKEKWIVLIGILDNNAYEIFALKEPDELTLPKQVVKGIITKLKRGVYKLSSKNGEEKEHILNIMSYMSEDDKADTRKYSLMLRHYIHPKFIVETIDKFSKDITSFDKAISRVLKLYVKDGEEITGDTCPMCGSKLIYEAGCAHCSCGWEKC